VDKPMGVWELMHEANAELVRRAWAAYDRGDEEAFAACLTDDWREYDSAGNSETLESEREAMRAHRTAFPDKHTEFQRIVADEEWVACHSTTTATHTGEYLGLAPTGRQVRLVEMMFNQVRDGRVCASWAIVDGPGFYEQLTGRPAPKTLDNMA
jgi:predicted ester cyclase